MLVVYVPVNRHPLAFFPTLDRAHIALQIGRDVLPGVQALLGSRRVRLIWRIRHDAGPRQLRRAQGSNSSPRRQGPQPTAMHRKRRIRLPCSALQLAGVAGTGDRAWACLAGCGATRICDEEVTNHVPAILRITSRRAKGLAVACAVAITCVRGVGTTSQETDGSPNEVLEWNQIFVDTLVVTNTANSSSQRLGAILHTSIFDAFNGIERRYEPSSFMTKRHAALRVEPLSLLLPTRRLPACFRRVRRRSPRCMRPRSTTPTTKVGGGQSRAEALPGEPKSLRLCSRGARPTGSARPIRRSLAAPRSGSGVRLHRPSAR